MIILEMMTPAGEEFDFVIALESERDDENVQYALEQGGCLMIDDSRAVQVHADDADTIVERIFLGSVLKVMAAYDSLEDDDPDLEEKIPIFDKILRIFATDMVRNSFPDGCDEVSQEDADPFAALFGDILGRFWHTGQIVSLGDYLDENNVEKFDDGLEHVYGLSDDLLLKIARGDVKIS